MEVHCHITQVFSCLPLKFFEPELRPVVQAAFGTFQHRCEYRAFFEIISTAFGGVEHFPLNAYNPAPALTCPAPAAYHPFNPHEISSSWLPRPSRTTVSCSSWGGAVRERSSPPRTRAAGDASPSASCRKRWRIPPPWLNSNG